MKAWLVGATVVAVAVVAAVLVWPHRESGQPAEPEPELIDYVALGDSFSAGPLIPDARGDPASCFRSTNNYPAYLAGYLDVTSYRDVTCSGASTRDLRRRHSRRSWEPGRHPSSTPSRAGPTW